MRARIRHLFAITLTASAIVGHATAGAADRPAEPGFWVETPPSNYHPLKHDAELIDALDLGRPELARVAELHRNGETAAALAALVAHFRHRTRPLPPKIPQIRDLREAKGIVAGIISSGGAYPPFTVKLPYDWEADPFHDIETTVSLSRESFVTTLVAAFRASGDDRYLSSAIAYVEDWLKRSKEARYLEGSTIQIVGRQHNWMPRAFWFNAAIRLLGPWPLLFFEGSRSNALSDSQILHLLRLIHNQADYVLASMVPGDNRTATAAGALGDVALMFPEFRRSADWHNGATSAQLTIAERQFAPDGVHIEMSPHYELVTLRSLALPLLLETRNDVAPDRRVLSAIERGLDYLVGVSDPARNLPVLKHADRTPLPPLLEPLRALFPTRNDFAFIATDGMQGAPPSYRSRAFPYAGHVAFRTGWDSDAIYLLFDAGPMGKLAHEDKLGLQMYAFGAPLLADPGRHTYNMTAIDRYLRSSKAHSIVLVDGRGQDRASCPKATWRPDRPTGVTLQYDGNGEASWGLFAGPWKSGAHVVHRRAVRFVEHRFFLVIDQMSPRDGRAHSYDGRFQLAEGDAEAGEGGVVFRSENGHAGLVIARLSAPVPTPAPVIVKGSKDPPGGWIAPKYGSLVPAPSVRYVVQPIVSAATFVTALVPFRGTVPPKVVLERLFNRDQSQMHVRIVINKLETVYVVPILDRTDVSSTPAPGRDSPCTP